jgi:hypothetical protein
MEFGSQRFQIPASLLYCSSGVALKFTPNFTPETKGLCFGLASYDLGWELGALSFAELRQEETRECGPGDCATLHMEPCHSPNENIVTRFHNGCRAECVKTALKGDELGRKT